LLFGGLLGVLTKLLDVVFEADDEVVVQFLVAVPDVAQ